MSVYVCVCMSTTVKNTLMKSHRYEIGRAPDILSDVVCIILRYTIHVLYLYVAYAIIRKIIDPNRGALNRGNGL